MRLLALLLTFLLLNFTPLYAKEAAFPATLPASYVGTLPCADCEGIDYKLNLLPDGVFHLRQTYLGRENGKHESIGLWTLAGSTLTLQEGTEIVERLQVSEKAGSLRMLDQQGQPIDSPMNLSLTRKNIFQPMKPELAMWGLFTYMADAARFEPCATGHSMPVVKRADYLALERAYLAATPKPGSPLLAQIDAQVLKQPRVDAEGSEPSVIIKRFIELKSATSCPSAQTALGIEDRTWTLIQLGEQLVTPPKDAPGAHLILMSKDQRVAGSGGCNRIMGGYALDGNKLSFSKMASTMMACQDGMALEQTFLKALDTVASWSIDGNTLILKDASGQVVARLSATP